jgi:hypothetical protein
MLLTIIVLLLVVAVWAVRLWTATTVPQLGWMSDQWIAEYRASHGS